MTRQIVASPGDDSYMSDDGNQTHSRRPGVVPLVLALALAACGAGDGVSTAEGVSGAADGVTTTDSVATEVVTTDATTAEAGSAADDAPGPMDLPASGFERQPEPGIYHLGAIGLPAVTFEIGDGWRITNVAGAGENSPFGNAFVRVTDRAGEPGRRDVHISRPTHLLDPSFIGPARPAVVAADVDLWDVADIGRWLDDAQAGGEWGVTDVAETEVSGHSAVTFTLQPDFVGCEGMEAEADGIRGEWTGCNGGIAWDMDTDGEGGGRLSVESWDGGQSEHLWIDDVDGQPLVVTLQFGYDIDEEWAVRSRAVLQSLAIG